MKLLITVEALELINNGFQGNGCGSGVVSKTLCWSAQRFMGVNLAKVWQYHDAEYSISSELKSTYHKIKADSYAHHNILELAGLSTKHANNGFKGRFAKIIHSVLILYGSSSYWV